MCEWESSTIYHKPHHHLTNKLEMSNHCHENECTQHLKTLPNYMITCTTDTDSGYSVFSHIFKIICIILYYYNRHLNNVHMVSTSGLYKDYSGIDYCCNCPCASGAASPPFVGEITFANLGALEPKYLSS